jgi:6-pyruvoyltetrahydropterin/6-carboxytetrahydropterin synthase
MSAVYTIKRKIEIDAGHRVHTHGSKCANFHGHRYVIWAECASHVLHAEGEQTDMSLDFSFLKDIMIARVDYPCDHGMILDQSDPLADLWVKFREEAYRSLPLISSLYLKTCWVNFVPTAERLAEYWYNEMADEIHERSKTLATLTSVTVEETPNCIATFRPPAQVVEAG